MKLTELLDELIPVLIPMEKEFQRRPIFSKGSVESYLCLCSKEMPPLVEKAARKYIEHSLMKMYNSSARTEVSLICVLKESMKNCETVSWEDLMSHLSEQLYNMPKDDEELKFLKNEIALTIDMHYHIDPICRFFRQMNEGKTYRDGFWD